MKLLWLCNMAPGLVRSRGGEKKGGLWMDHVLEDLSGRQDLQLCVLFPASEGSSGRAGENLTWESFPRKLPQETGADQAERFCRILKKQQPDVIHIWGTEFGHTLDMMRACEQVGLLERAVISIQGLVSRAADCFLEGIPENVYRGYTFRDLVRRDNIQHQQQTFRLRGENEQAALKLSRHVIGRTHWDRQQMEAMAPDARYHFCNETLRQEFYEDRWQYDRCSRHRIFASNKSYPIKGFHYLLQAFAAILETFPDAVLAVPGRDPAATDLKKKLRQDGYAHYLEQLIRKLGIQGHIEYLGSLSAEEMKQQYLLSNVFVLPSTLENSSNSLGEAMLLGVPCVAAEVGGVSTMLARETEGVLYPSGDVEALTRGIGQVFSLEARAEAMGSRARDHALKTHDAGENLQTLMTIYETIAGKDEKK